MECEGLFKTISEIFMSFDKHRRIQLPAAISGPPTAAGCDPALPGQNP
jgi:hypothetical protein